MQITKMCIQKSNTKPSNSFILQKIHPYAWLIFILLLPIGCRQKETTIKGRVKGVKSAVIEISGHTKLWDANIIDEKFQLSPGIERPEFYKLRILFSGGKNKAVEYPIYLAEGEYNFESDSADIQSYPVIKTKVEYQNELSDFYLTESQDSKRLEHFVRTHPRSQVSGYLLNQISEKDLRENPAYYAQLFRLLDPEITETSYAKDAKDKIEGYARILPGAPMPNVEGRTPDSKPLTEIC